MDLTIHSEKLKINWLDLDGIWNQYKGKQISSCYSLIALKIYLYQHIRLR